MTSLQNRSLKCLTAAAVSALLVFSSVGSAMASTSCFRGINLSGAEFGKPGGKVFKDYTWPSNETISYFAGKGFDTIRLPFMWERLQPKLMKPFDKEEANRLKEAVTLIRSHNMRVILDPHNYARYHGKIIGSADVPVAAFADFWKRLAELYPNEHDIVFGLMNEPYQMPVVEWLDAANAAAHAIRTDAGANNLLLVPGTAWTGAHSWMSPIDGEPNGVVMARFSDPANNYAFEVHQYFDDDFSGTKNNCSRGKDAVEAVKAFTGWLREHGHRGFLGEFGVPADKPQCFDALKAMVDVVEENKEVWTGWTYWVAGDWWPETEELNIQPTASGDRPQLQALLPALTDFSAQGKSCPALN
jgi:endoglucanase